METENVNTTEIDDVSSMFQTGNETEDVQSTIKTLAEFIVLETETLAKIKKDLQTRADSLDNIKAQLCQIMQQNGFSSCKLENGLNPATMIKTKYYKPAGLEDDTFFGWLNVNELGDIIKPTVNFNTMQSTLKDFVAQGGELPEIFNIVEVQSIRMNGKSKYLAMKS